jgi:hypothetical protein
VVFLLTPSSPPRLQVPHPSEEETDLKVDMQQRLLTRHFWTIMQASFGAQAMYAQHLRQSWRQQLP